MVVHWLHAEDRGALAPAQLGRAATLSSVIVADVRAAVAARRMAPGDFLGTEKDIAAKAGVSRIVARDALRTLEALGIVEIKMGAGGGARIARGNPRLFAEALAVQLDLAGTSAREILDAQRGVECIAAELAAENATARDLVKLTRLLDESEAAIRDVDEFTRVSFAFHLAMAEASHNRVLVVQLVSLQHVAFPTRNRTLTRPVARHVIEVHRQLRDLVEARDGTAARRVMDEHVRMIRARRVAEAGDGTGAQTCC
jgi:GntR family transcriptional repressor for pyruvate dehydrogenase complex